MIVVNVKEIKMLRIRHGYNQEQMANELNMSTGSYVHREKGVISFKANELAKIANLFDFTQKDMDIFFTKNVD